MSKQIRGRLEKYIHCVRDFVRGRCERLLRLGIAMSYPSAYFEPLAHSVRVQHLGQVDELQALGAKVARHKVLIRAVRPALHPAAKSMVQLFSIPARQHRHPSCGTMCT